jgi:hypothetical protein
MKYIYSLLFLLIGTSAWSQYNITAVNYDNNSVCQYNSKTIKVITTHPIGLVPNLALTANSYNGFLSIASSNIDSTASTGGTTYFSFSINDLYAVADNETEIDSFLIELREPTSNDTMDSYLVNDINVNGNVFPTMDLSGITFCSNGLSLDIANSVDITGGNFIWPGGTGSIIDPKLMNETNIASGGEGIFIDYNVTNSFGCNGSASEEITMNNAPIISITTLPSTCENADGGATANITDGTAPYDVYWSTGLSESAVSLISTISNASSGLYYANVTDAIGCKSVGTAHISDSDISVTTVISEETCNGMNDGLIDLTITSSGNITESFWSNGSTDEDMVGKDGEYSVEIHTDNNCNYYGTYIIPNNDLRVKLDNTNEIFGCGPTANNGSFDIITSGGSGNYTWSWENSTGAEVSTMEDLSTNIAGTYSCTVTDDSGCELTWSKSLPGYVDAGVSVNVVTKEDCGEENGSADLSLDWGEVSYWQWSNGSTDEDLTDVAAGTYTLEYRDNTPDQCANFIDVTIPNTRPYQPQICLLTVDTSLIYNQIVWEKDVSQTVDGFNIYRETTNYGEFEQVASLDFEDESFFIDNAASPVDRSWRYYITTFDGCSESYGSFIHKTIHIVVANTDLVTYDLAWDDYEGITYTDIDLMRFDATNGWETVVTLPAGTNSYTDTPTDITDIDYMVSFNLASPCTSTKAQDHNASRSNKSSAVFNPGGPTEIEIDDASIIESEEGQILMYPNPITENLNIYVENHEDYNTIKIVNMNGQTVYNNEITNSVSSINTSEFSTGVYFVQIISELGVVTQKIVKE